MANDEPPLAVRCRGLTKIYGDGATPVHALRGLDLDIYGGQLTLLVGPSGCGKTTLLSIIAGILSPTSGECWVLGQNVAELSSHDKARFRSANIGFVFQQYNLLPALTAAENATVPLAIAGWSKRKALVRARQLLEQLGMPERSEALPAKLSGGQQQRVAIARSLIHEPSLLVCDEPTSALDAHTGHAIMELLRSVVERSHRSVIVVTHDSRIFEFGDRIARMNDGQVTGVEEPSAPRAKSG